MTAPYVKGGQATEDSPVEILDLRHFSSADLRPLLQEESETWLRLLCWDYTGSADMILRYVDARILPGYAALDRGRLCGYSFFVYEGSKGVIGDLYVTRQGGTRAAVEVIETQLLTHVIETLQQSPGIHRVEAQLLVHQAGEVAAPFVSQGFRRHPRLFMALPLRGARELAPRKALPPGIEVRRWTDQDYQSAAGVITASYRGHVDSEINDQYRSIAGTLRFLNNIVRFPGCGVFDASASFLAIHRPTNMPVGLILCSSVKGDVGHITQVCVTPEYRGHGLGEALMCASAADLRRRGFYMLSLTVTAENRGAVQLYKTLGFSTDRIFDAFVWEG